MNKDEYSEVIAGKILLGKIIPTSVDTKDVSAPFDRIVELTQKSNWTPEMILEEVGFFIYNKAIEAATSVETLDADWAKLLRQSSIRYEVGKDFKDAADSLIRGEHIDVGRLIHTAYRLDQSEFRIIKGNEVDPGIVPFRKTYWDPIDVHIGGIPESGLTVIGAPPGVGKTSLLIRMAIQAAKNGKPTMLFSMEMTNRQLMYRFLQLDSSITEEQKSLISICDDIISPTELSTLAATVGKDIWFIGVDFAELMFGGGGKNSSSESIMAEVYRILATTAKMLNVPIVLLSQLNRDYQDSIPQITHLRYTGMAEALASLILLIYNPSAVFVAQDSKGALPRKPNTGYIIMGKSRYGHNYPGYGRFAIEVQWDGIAGWGTSPGQMRPL